jgi:hypothetical protein
MWERIPFLGASEIPRAGILVKVGLRRKLLLIITLSYYVAECPPNKGKKSQHSMQPTVVVKAH